MMAGLLLFFNESVVVCSGQEIVLVVWIGKFDFDDPAFAPVGADETDLLRGGRGPGGGRVVDVECYGESAITGTAQPRYTDADGPYVELSVGWTGLTGNIKVGIWNGRIEKQFSLQILDEKTFAEGNWYLAKKTG